MTFDYERLKIRQNRIKKAKETLRFQNITCFLQAKGFLILPINPKVVRNKKIDITDILWATRYEPRILEVFPAAFLHFPNKFTNVDKAPKKLLEIIKQLENGEQKGEDFKGIKYQDMKRWCNINLKDGRTTPLKEKKVLRSFTLSPEVDEKLNFLASEQRLTKTEVLENAIRNLKQK